MAAALDLLSRTWNGGSTVPVIQDMEWRQFAPQHLHGHHVDDEDPDGQVQDVDLVKKSEVSFYKKTGLILLKHQTQREFDPLKTRHKFGVKLNFIFLLFVNLYKDS